MFVYAMLCLVVVFRLEWEGCVKLAGKKATCPPKLAVSKHCFQTPGRYITRGKLVLRAMGCMLGWRLCQRLCCCMSEPLSGSIPCHVAMCFNDVGSCSVMWLPRGCAACSV